jgi:hypothetical protein
MSKLTLGSATLIVRGLLLLAALEMVATHLNSQTGTVKVPDVSIVKEGFTFTGIEIRWDQEGKASQLSALIRSDKASDWRMGLKFLVDVGTYAADVTGEVGLGAERICGVYQVLLLKPIKDTEQLTIPLRLVAQGPRCNPTGIRLHDFESAEDEIKRAERQAQLARLPKLQVPGEQVFLAADSKCLEETIAASRMDGLEKRKRLQELVSYGCVELVEGGVPVMVLEKQLNAVRVRIMDGESEGKTGWVLPQLVR